VKPRAPSLERVERVVWTLLRTPEGPEEGLRSLEAEGRLPAGELERWVEGDERLDAVGRVNIYANMYFIRQKDALREDFPACIRVLGEERYQDVFTAYLLAHPSSHYSLRYLGEAFPSFLAVHALAAELPYLPDLARLEWAVSQVLQAEDAPVLERGDLAAVPPEHWGDLAFRPVDAAALLDLSWDVVPLRGEAGRSKVAPRAHTVLVYRDGHSPAEEILTADEAGAWKAVIEGRTFGEVCEALAAPDDAIETAASRAAGFLLGWLDRRILSTLHLAASANP
jgi:hypothetical protein